MAELNGTSAAVRLVVGRVFAEATEVSKSAFAAAMKDTGASIDQLKDAGKAHTV